MPEIAQFPSNHTSWGSPSYHPRLLSLLLSACKAANPRGDPLLLSLRLSMHREAKFMRSNTPYNTRSAPTFAPTLQVMPKSLAKGAYGVPCKAPSPFSLLLDTSALLSKPLHELYLNTV